MGSEMCIRDRSSAVLGITVAFSGCFFFFFYVDLKAGANRANISANIGRYSKSKQLAKLANNVAQSWPTFINMLINVGATF